jgi:Na+-transporting NADH:ubiquinone oxidoreductase subunit NqrC
MMSLSFTVLFTFIGCAVSTVCVSSVVVTLSPRKHKTAVMSNKLYVEDIERVRKIKRLYHVTSAELFNKVLRDVLIPPIEDNKGIARPR